jgi:hypothetical protein
MAELNNSAEKTIANKIIKISHSPIEILKNKSQTIAKNIKAR